MLCLNKYPAEIKKAGFFLTGPHIQSGGIGTLTVQGILILLELFFYFQ